MTMMNTSNDTMNAAKHRSEPARESASHAPGAAKRGAEGAGKSTIRTIAGIVSTVIKSASAAATIASTLGLLERDKGLAWLGLARRRSPLVNVAILGAGAAVGAGLALMFAPTSGAELRSALLERSRHGAPEGPEPTAANEGAAALPPQ